MDKDLSSVSVPVNYELAYEALPFLVLASGRVESSALKTFVRDLELSLDLAFNSHMERKCFKKYLNAKSDYDRGKEEEIYNLFKKERERSKNNLVMFRKRAKARYKLF